MVVEDAPENIKTIDLTVTNDADEVVASDSFDGDSGWLGTDLDGHIVPEGTYTVDATRPAVAHARRELKDPARRSR